MHCAQQCHSVGLTSISSLMSPLFTATPGLRISINCYTTLPTLLSPLVFILIAFPDFGTNSLFLISPNLLTLSVLNSKNSSGHTFLTFLMVITPVLLVLCVSVINVCRILHPLTCLISNIFII